MDFGIFISHFVDGIVFAYLAGTAVLVLALLLESSLIRGGAPSGRFERRDRAVGEADAHGSVEFVGHQTAVSAANEALKMAA